MLNLLGGVENWERGRVEDMIKTGRRMRREGTEELAVRRECKFLSSHSMGEGTGTIPAAKGYKKTAILSKHVWVFASLEGDTPHSADLL